MNPRNLRKERRGVSEIVGFLIITAALFGAVTYVLVANAQKAETRAQGLIDVMRESEMRQGEFLSYVHASGASENTAGSWLSGWGYRVPITVSAGENGMPDNYQVRVVLNTASLISAGKMKSDAGDLRFTKSDGVTLLSYWIENGVNTPQTVIWVKDPSALSANASHTIYAYSANPSATGVSDPKAVFAWWDNFDTNSLANYTVLSGTWSWDSANKYLVCSSTGEIRLTGVVLNNLEVTAQLLQNYWATRVLVRVQDTSNYYGASCDPTGSNPSSRIVKNVSGSETALVTGGAPPSGTWTSWTVRAYGNNLYFKNYLGGTTYAELNVTDSAFTSGYVDLYGSVGDTKKYDNIRVRKYVSPEPTANAGTGLSFEPLKVVLYNYGTQSVRLSRVFVEGNEVQVVSYKDATIGEVYSSIPPGKLVEITFSCAPPSNEFYLTALTEYKGLYSWRVVL